MQLYCSLPLMCPSPPPPPLLSSPPLQPLVLILLDITPMMTCLGGVVMELQDCALTLLKGRFIVWFRESNRVPYMV